VSRPVSPLTESPTLSPLGSRSPLVTDLSLFSRLALEVGQASSFWTLQDARAMSKLRHPTLELNEHSPGGPRMRAQLPAQRADGRPGSERPDPSRR
jgi:hypothetical protein